MKPPKVTIIGAAGGVGSALAHLLISAPEPYEVALIGRSPESVTGLLMDAESLAPLGRVPMVAHGGTVGFHDSDVIVVAASVPLAARVSRVDSIVGNAGTVHPYFCEIAKISANWNGYVIVVTNPVDVLSGWLQRHARIDRSRILGYSWNDTLRLRVAVARVLGTEASDVSAWAIGEHGDALVPLLSRIRANGTRVQLCARRRDEVLTDLRGYYARWGRLGVLRTTPWTTAGGVARMIHDITRGGVPDWTASMALDGEYGLHDVNVGIPVTRTARGALSAVEWKLDEPEYTALRHAASLIRQRVDSLGRL
ncbi:malate dehydrogenase [Streptomyces albipurpureus]|uniref:Malate dehydrogenase n=1 Tax=Streptomyces albipurpureus TaxID=2897419 RepID=A0ABT0USR6_9ACTN|nr:hypothetical protein [Streptomyces sp. CWNU-1]MCM2391593.1 hypothetical protein [Streptomyces sp. CWNU-1]